jgi:hypothetical protein
VRQNNAGKQIRELPKSLEKFTAGGAAADV